MIGPAIPILPVPNRRTLQALLRISYKGARQKGLEVVIGRPKNLQILFLPLSFGVSHCTFI